MLKGICQKEGNIFVKRRVIYLLKGICQKEGNIFVKRRVIYLSKGVIYLLKGKKEGNILSKGG